MKMKWLAGLCWLCAVSALAQVSLDLSYDTATYTNRLRSSESMLTFLFSIDGSGTVSLDASTSDPSVDIIAIVNSWDGPVGTVSDSSLWGTSFTLQATAYAVTNGLRDLEFEPDQTGGIAIQGNNSGRIDGVGPGRDPEYMELTLMDGSVALNFGDILYVGGAGGSDFYVADSTASNAFYDVGSDGTRSISGLSLTTDGALSIAQPADTDQYDKGWSCETGRTV